MSRALTAAVAAFAVAACTWDWERFEGLRPQGAPGGNYRLTFQEECDGTAVERSRWNTAFTSPDRQTVFRRYSWTQEWVADANVLVGAGLCRIKVENRPSGDGKYTGGTLNSANKFEQRWGFFEAKLKVPRGKGLRTRLVLSDPSRWPPEIDYYISGEDPTKVVVGLWYRPSPEAQAEHPSVSTTVPDLSDGFHVIGIEWRTDALRFFVDGALIGTVTEGLAAFDTPARMQFVVHVGQDGQPQPDATTPFPSELQIDWVRVWQREL